MILMCWNPYCFAKNHFRVLKMLNISRYEIIGALLQNGFVFENRRK